MTKVNDIVNVVRQVIQISFLHWREWVKKTQQEKNNLVMKTTKATVTVQSIKSLCFFQLNNYLTIKFCDKML